MSWTRPVLIGCRDRLSDRPEHRHVIRDETAALPVSSVRSATTPRTSAVVHEWLSDTEIPSRRAACAATPPPANLMPRVKNPARQTRVCPCVELDAHRQPELCPAFGRRERLCRASLSTSIVGDTATDWRFVAKQSDLSVEVQAPEAADRASRIAAADDVRDAGADLYARREADRDPSRARRPR